MPKEKDKGNPGNAGSSSVSPFRFNISGDLADFAALVAIIRGDSIDERKLAEMANNLSKASKALQKAENEAVKSGTNIPPV